MTPINIQLSSSSGHSGDWLIPFLLICGVIWLFVLAAVLYNKDLDPITKLTWVVVVIFVPFFGVFLYWFRPGQTIPGQTIDPSKQLSGTPWENNPGYTDKSKEV